MKTLLMIGLAAALGCARPMPTPIHTSTECAEACRILGAEMGHFENYVEDPAVPKVCICDINLSSRMVQP